MRNIDPGVGVTTDGSSEMPIGKHNICTAAAQTGMVNSFTLTIMKTQLTFYLVREQVTGLSPSQKLIKGGEQQSLQNWTTSFEGPETRLREKGGNYQYFENPRKHSPKSPNGEAGRN